MNRFNLKLIILLFLAFSCFSNKPNDKPFQVLKPKETSLPKRTYDSTLIILKEKKSIFNAGLISAHDENEKQKVLNEAGSYLCETLTKEIFPYWYGTDWDFNGYTDKPGDGKIACGYFVSTTLKHSGLKVNRYKLAQQYSHKIVQLLTGGKEILTYRNISSKKFTETMRSNYKDGLYVVGLDFHVGFILKEKDQIYFIHSSYRSPVKVVKEKAEESAALSDSKVFVLGSLSNNQAFVKNWLEGKEILVK